MPVVTDAEQAAIATVNHGGDTSGTPVPGIYNRPVEPEPSPTAAAAVDRG
jgi:hypothetical protein